MPSILSNPFHLVIGIASIGFALVIHEFAHAWMAYQLGDPTAKYEKRLTLNPVSHFDPAGALCLVCSFILSNGAMLMGWAKPVPIDSGNFKNPQLDTALVAAAGPFVNFFASFLFSMPILLGLAQGLFAQILAALIVANVGFGLFNLITWPPLDGWKILGSTLGSGVSAKMERFEQKLGVYSLLGLFFLIFLLGPTVLGPANRFLLSIFLGGAS